MVAILMAFGATATFRKQHFPMQNYISITMRLLKVFIGYWLANLMIWSMQQGDRSLNWPGDTVSAQRCVASTGRKEDKCIRHTLQTHHTPRWNKYGKIQILGYRPEMSICYLNYFSITESSTWLIHLIRAESSTNSRRHIHRNRYRLSKKHRSLRLATKRIKHMYRSYFYFNMSWWEWFKKC